MLGMNDVLAGAAPLSPAVVQVLGTTLAVRLLLPTLLRAVVSLLAIFLPINRAKCAERVLLILHERPDVQPRSTATEEHGANLERRRDDTDDLRIHTYGTTLPRVHTDEVAK